MKVWNKRKFLQSVWKRKLVQSVNSRYTECDGRKRETCEIVLISQEMKSKKGGSHEKKNFMYAAECSNAAYEFAGCFCGGDAACEGAADEGDASVYG